MTALAPQPKMGAGPRQEGSSGDLVAPPGPASGPSVGPVAPPPSQPVAVPDRPCRPDGMVLHRPPQPDGPWVLELQNGRYTRVGHSVGELLDKLDGRADEATLLAQLGAPWTADVLHGTVAQLAAKGLVVAAPPDGIAPAAASPSRGAQRIKLVGATSLQLTLVRPGARGDRLAKALAPLASAPAVVGLIGLGVLGAFVMAANADRVGADMSSPMHILDVLAVIFGFSFINSLHEMGHAAALARYGGRARRFGIMLLYFTPALFCDVSDAWTLREPRQRRNVALAGAVVNVACAGAVSIVAASTSGALSQVCFLVAAACYFGACSNLLPLVKFDGYIALMTSVDIPYLRQKALFDWYVTAAKALFGGRGYQRQLPGQQWAPWYGLGCAVAPWALVGLVCWQAVAAFASWGHAGALISLSLAAVIVTLLARAVLRLPRLARQAGASRGRLLVGALAVMAVVAGIGAIPISEGAQGGFWVAPGTSSSSQRVYVSLDTPRAVSAAKPGAVVELRRQGLFVSSAVGTAVVASRQHRGQVPLSALVPFVQSSWHGAARWVALSHVHWDGAAPRSGAVTIGAGHDALGLWLTDQFVKWPIKALMSW